MQHYEDLDSQESSVKLTRILFFAILVTGAAGLLRITDSIAHPKPPAGAALSGQVTSTEEGAMEGVLVTVKKDGSTIAHTVYTDAHGHYVFPSANLEPGHYSIKIRAAGYDLDSPSRGRYLCAKRTRWRTLNFARRRISRLS